MFNDNNSWDDNPWNDNSWTEEATEATTTEAATQPAVEPTAPPVVDIPVAPVETTPIETTPAPTQPEFKPEKRWLTMDEILVQGYSVIDLETGEPIISDNEALPLEAGGLTRLMTLYTVLTDPDYDPERPVALDTISDPESPFVTSEQLTTETALFAMFYETSDDAALALVETYGPGRDDFLKKMQRNAKTLGMKDSRYGDPLGIELGSITTAADTVKLIQALYEQQPFLRMIEKPGYALPDGSKHSVSGSKTLENPATMLDTMSSDYLTDIAGIMLTGSAEGWSYGVGTATTNNDRKLLAVALGASSKIEEIQGKQRAAQALRTLLEQGAKSIGVRGVKNRSLLSIVEATTTVTEPPQETTTVPQETTEASQTTVTEKPTTQEPTTEAPTTQPTVTTQEEPQEAEKPAETKQTKSLFYILLVALVIAVIALIIVSVALSRKNKESKETEEQK